MLTVGSGNWTVPNDVTVIIVEAWGAGGGGGKGLTAGSNQGSGGGHSGAYVQARIGVTPNTLLPYVVGAAGVGATAAGTAGAVGGSTTFAGTVTRFGRPGRQDFLHGN